jgi:hypothetical protein
LIEPAMTAAYAGVVQPNLGTTGTTNDRGKFIDNKLVIADAGNEALKSDDHGHLLSAS